ncbi:hypothetical protein NLG97_g10190 [Lecanicillium saksenae]|uniref:Uncharacterized protein n=1 Tax=Lecanicillium saksenae TaxID=468837 RepID=A0ACC1QFQ2_9HYPO|nr:hypothetical protein NLG97_g10190 [Lecanicillium saksenae]
MADACLQPTEHTEQMDKMLLYTRRALPKIPKKRSRAANSRVKKKKCDEHRPICARCKEAGQECVYGPLRPRQRRTAAQIEADTANATKPSESTASGQQNDSIDSDLPLPVLDESWQDVGLLGDGHAFANGLQNDAFDASGLELVHPLDSTAPSSTVAKWSPMHGQAGAFYATPHLELNMPLFSEYTTIKGRRGLLDHFSNVLSHLIVLREDEGNPFQQLVLPMSRQSPAVASAIYALSSAHLEFRGVAGVEQKSILFHSEAARNLANLIEKGAKGNQNELLAAVILLIYYEVLVHRERSQIVHGHLKGAVAILNSGPPTSDPTRAFLERAFRFYDVIAALSFRTPTLSEAPKPGCINHFLPVDSRGASRPAAV